MIISRIAALYALALVLAGGTADAASLHRKAAAHPAPDIDGYWRVNFILPMEAPAGVTDLVVSEAEARIVAAKVGKALSDEFAAQLDPELPMLVTQSDGLPIVRGERRTRAVVLPRDGKLPYTKAARKELAGPGPLTPTDNPEQRPNSERCLVGQGQPPLSSFALDSQIQIIRTPDHVVIHVEYGDDVRIIPLTRTHAPREQWSRLGDSIGHWEGKTLVVETIGQPDEDRFHIAPNLIVPGAATVIERFTPISDRELLYQFTVIDPKVYSAPWLGEFSWFRTDKQMYESACHEGNHAFRNILSAARSKDRSAGSARPAMR